MDLRAVLIEIHTALHNASIDHALIGGLALAAHHCERATVDLDLLADAARADDVDEILVARGYACLHRSENVANYASEKPERGRVDFLFALRSYGRAILARAQEVEVLGLQLRVVDAADLIGLKAQSSSNDPTRRRRDLADIERLLAQGRGRFGTRARVLPNLRSREGTRRAAVRAASYMTRRELEAMREDGLSEARGREFRASERAVARWERDHRSGADVGLAAVLTWIDQLRAVFGEPVVDRKPWLGDDYPTLSRDPEDRAQQRRSRSSEPHTTCGAQGSSPQSRILCSSVL